AASPTQSSGTVTSWPRSSARRAAAGSRLSFESGPFFGRPRWLAQTRRAPRSSACLIVGSASRMRESSVIFRSPGLPSRPGAGATSSRGTLKSTRRKTRLFSIGSSRIDRIPSSGLLIASRAPLSKLGGDELGELDHAVREAPLVVVPGEDLGEAVAHHLRD